MRRSGSVILCLGIGLLASGCPKGQSEYNQGRKAETLQDYDAAVEYYQKALKANPNNANFKIKLNQIRFEAAEQHVKTGTKLRADGDLQGAVAQFQRALAIDPSSPIADQELRKTLGLIGEKSREEGAAGQPPEDESQKMASGPAVLKPMMDYPINLKMANDARIVFDTIGKLAGLTVVYDPDFPARKISADLPNVTLEQALDIVSLESKAVWKPVTENIIFVFPDQPQKRKDYEEEVVQTFYMANTVQPQDLTELVTGLRQMFDLRRIQQINSQNAIIIRDTPDKIALIDKVIRDVDKAKPEVVVQVEILEARTDRLRDLGVLPGQSASLTFNPPSSSTTTTTTGGTSTTTGLPLNQLKHLGTKDYNVNLPGAVATAILTDSYTKIIQNPEIRSVDGQIAKLRIGDKVPVATGSFQTSALGGGTAGLVSPLINTQFQYLEVGVNIDMTPRVHPNHEVSLKAKIEVSSVTGQSPIGGINQPIISQRVVEHDIRLKEGEVNILGGLIQRTDTKTLNGWPGFARIPLLRYFFSDDRVDHQEDEVLVVLIPHIVRLPELTRANLRTMYSGPDMVPQVKREKQLRAPVSQPPAATSPSPAAVTPGATPPAAAAPAANPPQGTQPSAKLRFEPQSVTLKTGETKVVALVVDSVTDLFSIPLLVQYNPAVISVEEVQHAVNGGQRGGFLSGGTQDIAIVENVNKEKGQAIISATRQPNTSGVSGSGTLLGIVIKGIAPGSSSLSIVQVNAKDSQQKLIPLVAGEATVQVQP